MKILQLSKKLPYPLRDGESVAVHALTTAMCAMGCEYTLLVMNTSKHPAITANLPANYTHYTAIHTVDVDTDVKVVDAFLNLFTSKSYNISRFDNPDFHQKLISLLQETAFDMVQLETLFLTPYIDTIRQYSQAKIVLRAHNVEYEIWERMARNESFLPKKYYLNLLVNRLKRYEIAQLNRPDLIVGITERDNQCYRDLGCKTEMLVAACPADSRLIATIEQKTVSIEKDKLQLENLQSINLQSANLQATNLQSKNLQSENLQSINSELESLKNPQIGFLGSLDWLPNQEGIAWFIAEVWAKARDLHPNFTLNIAGRNTPPEFVARYNNTENKINVLGEVSDAQAFVESNDVMIVPILSGSGMRIKIVEAMALGKVVIATSVGAEGISGVHNHDFMLADTPDEFVACLESCFNDAALRQKIQTNAPIFIKKHFDASAIATRVVEAFRNAL